MTSIQDIHTFDMQYAAAVQTIKAAIQRSQARAIQTVNREMLSLYYGIGRYISENSRRGFWGTGAIKQISEQLQKEMPGLKGFGESMLKRMRTFYEEWSPYINRYPAGTDLRLSSSLQDNRLDSIQYPMGTELRIDEYEMLSEIRQPMGDELNWSEFVQVPFSHHILILRKRESFEERSFFIHECAVQRWTKYQLEDYLNDKNFSSRANLPNNFSSAISDTKLAIKTAKAFKNELLLDFINVDDLYEETEDRNEPMLNSLIVDNIKQFIERFGQGFLFMGPQYRVKIGEEEKFIDLLFFNRILNCLVAVELKDARFQPSHLGQLAFYLTALDETVRQPHENPSVGIVLCREMDKTVVEVAIRDYTKPMGVARFHLGKDAPEDFNRVFPDFNELNCIMYDADKEQ
ncbi:MAG: PDDEXK nuclease domain-containing protein [Bacteroidales bacterium]|nr:PDDEXK nuclease domain-containing protein [Bacteroidales bacterium]